MCGEHAGQMILVCWVVAATSGSLLDLGSDFGIFSNVGAFSILTWVHADMNHLSHLNLGACMVCWCELRTF